MKLQPKSAEAWFAVGCYYSLINVNNQARRFFESVPRSSVPPTWPLHIPSTLHARKATKIDNDFAVGWIGYGNAFAAQVRGGTHDKVVCARLTSRIVQLGRE